MGLGVPSDGNFKPITSFVSLSLLGNEIVVGVTLLGYGRKHVTLVVFENPAALVEREGLAPFRNLDYFIQLY